MKKTCNLGAYEHLLCIGHGLHNLVAVDGFKRTKKISELIKKVRNIIKALRYRTDEFENLSKDQALVAKEMSDLSEMLFSEYDDEEEEDEIPTEANWRSNSTTSLKLDVKTRWHSMLIMLKSLHAQNKTVVNLMLQKTDHADMILINNDLQLSKELIEFLQHFQRITAILSGDQYATLNYYIVFRSEVHSLLESEPQDSNDLKELKKTCYQTSITDSHCQM